MDSQPVCMKVVMRHPAPRQDIRRGIRYAIRDMGEDAVEGRMN